MKRKFFASLLILSGALLSALGFSEILLRFAPEPRFAANIVFDPHLGHRGPLDGFVDYCGWRVFYNQWGFRDRNFFPAQQKQRENVRVVVLGDSITEAVGVDDKSSWGSQLSNRLGSELGKLVDVYKFTASDWGSFQEVLALEKFGPEVEPQLVVLQFLGLNDFVNNTIAFAGKNQSENDDWRPYFDPANPVGRQWLNPTKNFFREYSYLYRFYNSYQVNRHLFGLRSMAQAEGECESNLQLFLENPDDPRWHESLEVTKGIARRLAQYKKSKIVAVYFPSSLEVVDSQWQDGVRAQLQRCFPGKKINARWPERNFEIAFREAGLGTISLFDDFARKKDPERLFDSSGHLSAEGHRFVSQRVADHLIQTKAIEN